MTLEELELAYRWEYQKAGFYKGDPERELVTITNYLKHGSRADVEELDMWNLYVAANQLLEARRGGVDAAVMWKLANG